MQKEPSGDVYRLYLEYGKQSQEVRLLQETVQYLQERLADLTSRVVNLEPVSDTSALAVMGDGKVVDIAALGDVYTNSPFLRHLFSPDGHPLYNASDPERPTGFARGKFPEDAESSSLIYVCGDDYNEVFFKMQNALCFPGANPLEITLIFPYENALVLA